MKKNYFSLIGLMLLISSALSSQTIWTDTPITFTKADYADWTLEANQDRMTSNVWLTRRNNQGPINFAQEMAWQGPVVSPVGTRWAIGTTSDLGSLTFDTLMATVSGSLGNNLVGQDLVLHLVDDDIYLDIRFTSWTGSDNGGGFSYIRSTGSTLDTNEFETDKGISLKSNIVTNQLILQGFNTNFDLAYSIYDIHGRQITTNEKLQDQNIDVSYLSHGIYILRVAEQSFKFIKN